MDERFREALGRAEIAPPEGLWTAIAAARSGGRRSPGYLRPVLALLLLALLSTGSYLALNKSGDQVVAQDHEYPEARPVSHTTSTLGPVAGNNITDASPQASATQARAQQEVLATQKERSAIRKAIVNSHDQQHIVPEPAARAVVNGAAQTDLWKASASSDPVVDPVHLMASVQAPTDNIVGDPLSEGTPFEDPQARARHGDRRGEALAASEPVRIVRDVDAVASYLQVRPGLANRSLPNEPLAASPQNCYVLPKGHWWLAMEGALLDGRSLWQGRDAELAIALNAAEAHTGTVAFGGILGRSWQSGFGVSAGLIMQRSQRQFFHLDRRTETTEEVFTYLVTLDSEVIFQSADTTTNVSVNERTTRSSDVRTVLRIPVDVHWQGHWRRWGYGLRAGLALETTANASGPTLLRDPENGAITSGDPGPGSQGRRHPAMLLGAIGAEIGFHLTEHWSLWAGPAHMVGMAPIGPHDDVYAMPARTGLRFRLTHHIGRIGRDRPCPTTAH